MSICEHGSFVCILRQEAHSIFVVAIDDVVASCWLLVMAFFPPSIRWNWVLLWYNKWWWILSMFYKTDFFSSALQLNFMAGRKWFILFSFKNVYFILYGFVGLVFATPFFSFLVPKHSHQMPNNSQSANCHCTKCNCIFLLYFLSLSLSMHITNLGFFRLNISYHSLQRQIA